MATDPKKEKNGESEEEDVGTQVHLQFVCNKCDKSYGTTGGLKKHNEYRHKGKENI